MTRARICLIDDDTVVRDAMALGLTDCGFEVVAAHDAAAGLELAGRELVHAMVADMNMPGACGAELIAAARARWPDMAIVAISGAAATGGRNTADVASQAGADAILIKPFRARQLADAVEAAMAAHSRASG
jgi:two-component system OmpR family response regulator